MKCPKCKKMIQYQRTDEDIKLFEKAAKWWDDLSHQERLEHMYDLYCIEFKKGKLRKL